MTKKSICLLNDNITENTIGLMLSPSKPFFKVLCFENSQTMDIWRQMTISLGYIILGCQNPFDLAGTL